MPPIRSFPNSKPVKTERSHEENQERAYIAASRRSDRSLEARIESARRASEIHKRRTGRSLRVTEQDVVNEEMYEEEDDDLPLHYRRLTAHLNTSSPDFNRRLAAYLSNQLAMRTALDQALSNTYALQQANSALPLATNFLNAQQQWNQGLQGVPQANSESDASHSATSPQMMLSPTSYNQSPYSMLLPQVIQPIQMNPLQNSAAMTKPGAAGAQSNAVEEVEEELSEPSSGGTKRRMSAPAEPPSKRQLLQNRTMSSSSLPTLDETPEKPGSAPPGREGKPKASDAGKSQDNPTNLLPQQNYPLFGRPDISPLTTTLPPETQMMLGFDPNTAFGYSYLESMNNNAKQQQQSFFPYNPNTLQNPQYRSQFDGMSQTLAPSMLDATAHAPTYFNTDSNFPDDAASTFNTGFDQNYGSVYGNDIGSKFPSFNASQGSGNETPDDREWASFIDTAPWGESSQE